MNIDRFSLKCFILEQKFMILIKFEKKDLAHLSLLEVIELYIFYIFCYRTFVILGKIIIDER